MKIKISVPTDLKDIKLSQYQKFLRTTKGSEDERWITRQMIGIFCNIPDDAVDRIRSKDYHDIISNLSNMLKQEPGLTRLTKVDGKTYGFIPKLEDITVGEQADIEANIQDWDKMDLAMGVLYRPVTSKAGEKYLIQEYNGDGVKLDLTMDVVFGSILFFYNLTNDLLSCTQRFIEGEAVKPKASQILEANGVGINQFMQSLGETFLTMKRSLVYD
jgi:hypothetical protein